MSSRQDLGQQSQDMEKAVAKALVKAFPELDAKKVQAIVAVAIAGSAARDKYCTATTLKGQRCKNVAKFDGVCPMHTKRGPITGKCVFKITRGVRKDEICNMGVMEGGRYCSSHLRTKEGKEWLENQKAAQAAVAEAESEISSVPSTAPVSPEAPKLPEPAIEGNKVREYAMLTRRKAAELKAKKEEKEAGSESQTEEKALAEEKDEEKSESAEVESQTEEKSAGEEAGSDTEEDEEDEVPIKF